jgi:hypothetical protein
MEIEVEVRIVHPDGKAGAERHKLDLLAEARDQVNPLSDEILELLERQAAVGPRGRVEDGKARDVHVDVAAFDEQEVRIEGAKAVGHDFPPRRWGGSPVSIAYAAFERQLLAI